MRLKSVTPLGMAALLAAVLALRVFTDFTPARAVLIRTATAVDAGTVEIALPPGHPLRGAPPPLALVARLDGPAGHYAFELDGLLVCTADGSRGGDRIDCAAAAPVSGLAPMVRVTGPSCPWTLRYLELATHHGSSSGLFETYVVPRGKRVAGVSAAGAAAAGAALAALFLLPGVTPRGRARGAHLALSGVVVAILLLVLAAPWISPFKVVIAPHTWGLCALILAGPRALGQGRRFFAASSPRARQLAVAALATAVVAAAGAQVVRQAANTYYGGNISGLVQIAEARFDAHPTLRHRGDLRASLVLHQGTGYDAQFMYFAAFDPLLRSLPNPEAYRGFIDAPPYRYPRSGFVWLTKLVSLDDARRYPAAMVSLGVAGFAATAAALAAIAIRSGGSPLWGLAVFGIPGMLRSLMLAMPEPVSAALAAFAMLCLLQERIRWAAACFAAAVLVRETTALLLLIAVGWAWREGKRHAAGTLLLALAPYAAWRIYVGWMLFPDWGVQGFFFNPRAYDLPVKPIIDLFVAGAPHPDAMVARASYWFAGLLVVAGGAAFALARTRPRLATIAAAGYGVMAMSLDRDIIWTHVSNLERTTYELFLMLAVAGALSSTGTRRERRVIAAVLAAAALYVLWLGNDAPFMRRAMLGL